MPGWNVTDEGRWERDGDDRHLLLHAGGRLVELHGSTVHVYLEPADLDGGNPLFGATWVGTFERPDLDGATPNALWRAMGAKQYTTASAVTDPQP